VKEPYTMIKITFGNHSDDDGPEHRGLPVGTENAQSIPASRTHTGEYYCDGYCCGNPESGKHNTVSHKPKLGENNHSTQGEQAKNKFEGGIWSGLRWTEEPFHETAENNMAAGIVQYMRTAAAIYAQEIQECKGDADKIPDSKPDGKRKQMNEGNDK